MNEDQRKALQASIEHWRENVERHARGEDMKTGSDYCACCVYSEGQVELTGGGDFCSECPIAQYTGEDDCNKTPYYAVIRGVVPPTEMLDWLAELEAGGTPPLLFNEPYRQ
jgi:hypothetical protein